MANELTIFAKELVDKCNANDLNDTMSPKCLKAIYLQKVILLKVNPDNYNKKIKIDIPNSDEPIVIEDSAGETGDSGSSKGASGPPVDSGSKDASQDSNDPSAGAPVVPPGASAGSQDGKGATNPPVDSKGAASPPVDMTTGASAGANGSGPPGATTTSPPGTSLDKNIVILSYDNGSYSVKNNIESGYHVLERKNPTECFAYNPSYKPSETSETVSVGKKLSDVAQDVGNKLSNVAQGLGNRMNNAVQGAVQRVTQKFRGSQFEKLDESDEIIPLITKGGKLRTKKRRITKKRVQKKPFKSRSKK